MNYQYYDELLTGRCKDSKRLELNTYAKRLDEKTISIRLYDTDIVIYKDNGVVELNSGGFRTATTKDRINKYSPLRLRQEKSVWYVMGQDTTVVFFDGIQFKGGKAINAKSEAKQDKDIKRISRNKKLAKDYTNGFIEALKNGGVDLPSGGDCWFCCMREVGNMTLGDITNNATHIIEHIKEKYYVPTLAVNAVLEDKHTTEQLGFILGYDSETQKLGGRFMVEWIVKKAIYKYVLKRLEQTIVVR